MFDGCGVIDQLSRDDAREVIRAILERKYGKLCPPEYNAKVLASIIDDPVRLARPPKARPQVPTNHRALSIVVNEGHEIFHVRERGYVEAPVRIASILEGLKPVVPLAHVPVKHFPDSHVTAVHDRALVDFIRKCSASMPPGKSTYPYVFPDPQPREAAQGAGAAGRLFLHRHLHADQCQLLAGRAARRRLRADGGAALSGGAAVQLCPDPPARPSCRAQGLWRLLLSQQCGHRRAISCRAMAASACSMSTTITAMARRISSTSPPRCADRFDPRPSAASPIPISPALPMRRARARATASISTCRWPNTRPPRMSSRR